MQSKVLAGPHLKVVINGRVFGIVQSFRFSIRTTHRPVQGIDQNTIQEFIPTVIGVQGQVQCLRLRGSGGLEGAGIVPFSQVILLEKYVKIDLLDRVTDKLVFSAINAVIQDQSWQVEAKGHMTGSFSFEASDWTNEAAV